MKTIYLSKRMGKEILKDMEFVLSSKSWKEVERVYDKYSTLFNKKMEPLFGQDGSVALENDIFNYEFHYSPIERFKQAIEEQWPKYTVIGGFAHWVFTKMEELEEEVKTHERGCN